MFLGTAAGGRLFPQRDAMMDRLAPGRAGVFGAMAWKAFRATGIAGARAASRDAGPFGASL